MTTPDRPFLDVESSISGQRWEERMSRTQAGQAEAMRERHSIPELVARVLAARDVTADEALGFLDPKLRDLMPDPSLLTGMDAAADRLVSAIAAKEPVAVFGDYDVDGATSSALLAAFLRNFDVPVEIYIPDRIFEGYGPNENAIRELAERGAKLLVTVDCGSTSHDALAVAKSLGLDAVVLDHHQVGDELPDVIALVNPNRQDDLSGQGHLCAAGVVFLTLVATQRAMRQQGKLPTDKPVDLMQSLDLVALGTVCDVVPLKGLNRAFVTRGIEVMQKQRNVGLAALARVARQDGPAAPWHLGFVLGPRINAGGRIGDAALGARLLTTSDPTEAEEIAQQLDTLNGERQNIETAMLAQAIDEAEAEIGFSEGPSVLVTESDTWHAGVVGLLASRLKDRFNRPTFAIAFDGRGRGQGSGRSIPGCDLGRTVRAAVDEGLLLKGGGHAMAAGITIERDKLGDFRAFMEERLCDDVATARLSRSVRIDGALSARGATVEMFDQLAAAGPFGAGHSQPLLAFPRHTLRFSDVVGKGHVRFSIGSADGAELRGISFRAVDTPLGDALLDGRGKVMHFAGTLSADFFRGTRRVQLRLVDVALAQ
ncbi:single-stranded-DNA-specific exonuclease RecJ [Ahrensia sp. R2A130]|uniref:single-stranded-DNA-specific exonuclease RecJ n=1 Tax=Ahrensia sp. R2A130 TaxID=744979 RepID=UPI0001E083A6|nr:single-stranded-DNA-specific exonuclease RecJ [Ahrensia sp. R2A130]